MKKSKQSVDRFSCDLGITAVSTVCALIELLGCWGGHSLHLRLKKINNDRFNLCRRHGCRQRRENLDDLWRVWTKASLGGELVRVLALVVCVSVHLADVAWAAPVHAAAIIHAALSAAAGRDVVLSAEGNAGQGAGDDQVHDEEDVDCECCNWDDKQNNGMKRRL